MKEQKSNLKELNLVSGVVEIIKDEYKIRVLSHFYDVHPDTAIGNLVAKNRVFGFIKNYMYREVFEIDDKYSLFKMKLDAKNFF